MQGEHHLKQRRPGQVAFRLQGFDQLLERQVLVGVREEGGVAGPTEELPERRVARQVAS